ncbi:uncharacterized protein LOC122068786 [Macadamia integrifolia]|uniref:uncharacterized protein LOC122068786 n=1 Tax=Macadamia integrifolia TaxID=60698 RepID=UPI001C4EA0D2|nr:uncharacterized protein LOC122068786 [Macadamia integrifolia]XP_042488621.1 uncharacterized protein LOC122068786 [Macadamia integrifolia]XP_042488622.1 uncharacterized protein LOC122068786 [Macadamia integrifolia]
MAPVWLSRLQSLWPFSLRKPDDLKVSDGLVHRLSLPEQTKQFVFAICVPESQSVIYILASQNLSERSAADAECLIKAIRPEVVIAQVSPSALLEIQDEESILGKDLENTVPTSAFGVLKGCFVNKINKDKYENLASGVVLREIFGVGFHGHFLAAKKAANEVGSSFLLLESPHVKACEGSTTEAEVGNKFQALGLQPSNLVPQRVGCLVSSSSNRFCLADDLQSQILKSLVSAPYLSISDAATSSSVSGAGFGDYQPMSNYQAPSFAQSIYSLLTDLHDIFTDLPLIGRALAHTQKMLFDVEQGETVDMKLLSEIHNFRVAVEGLRIALNGSGRCATKKMGNNNKDQLEFAELSTEEKSDVLFAQALRSQTKKFRSIVAIVDASRLAGLRKHWNTSVPQDIEDLVERLFTEHECDEEMSTAGNMERRRLLADKPVVAVGAGATVVLGASSLSKVLPASMFVKLFTYKVPASLKILLTQSQKAAAIAFGKTVGSSKVLAPGLATSGAKTSSAMKAAASAEKIRAVTHSVIASAERTSFSAMRTAFYEIMRKRRVQPVRAMPWATFMCSVATCTGLLVYGDGIEFALESLPVAPSIANLGRGLQSLQQASEAVRQSNSTKIQEAMQSLMYSFTKRKLQ